jgi:uncharacterized membrane protein YoaK (UPF0700 family)
MKQLGQAEVRDLLLLSLTAGSADAAGFLGLGRVFTSNMTGNVVLLGIDLGQGDFLAAARIVFVVAVFILGVSLGTWLAQDIPEKQWPTLAFRLIRLEKVVLVLFAIGWFLLVDRNNAVASHGLLALLALAMGLQSAAMNRLSVPGVATTAVTGTLTALTSGTLSLLLLSKPGVAPGTASPELVRFHLGVVVLYVGGAALGGWLIVHLPHVAGCFPVLAAAFVALGKPKP